MSDNAHKWLGAAFDCSLYYVRDAEHLSGEARRLGVPSQGRHVERRLSSKTFRASS
jgi:glutamate/tyrosine decarboxylase-like PLP-dependent enzyme